MGRQERLYFIADFNVESLARYIANTALPDIETRLAPPGPVGPTLAGGAPAPDWSAIVWTQPSSVIDAYRRAQNGGEIDLHLAVEEVHVYATAIARLARRTRTVFVPTWVAPPFERGTGMLDFRPDAGLGHLLARMNLTLADALRGESSVFVLDANRWLAVAGPRGWSQKLWFATKCPFTSAVIEQVAADIVAALDGIAGRARRIILLDLDNVLWDGVVGEAGWAGLNLGGHDHVGEAFTDFQRALKALASRGIQLAIVSKNDEATALEAIDRHPEMQLRRADFAGWRINWNDKARNVVDLLAELNLGAESAVFIDDSPIERARIQTAIPDILVPEWPDDPARFREALSSLRCFDSPLMTAEDRQRTNMAVAERSRRAASTDVENIEEWLQSLGITVTVEALMDANLDRVAQLLNKTNQMNLATRRLSKGELEAWAAQPEHCVLAFRVSDRFGDSGLTGLLSLRFTGATTELADFLLSCRVMGRNVEDAMLHIAIEHARARRASPLCADFRPTARNRPCHDFFRRSGFRQIEENRFVWDASQPYACPRWVTVLDHVGVASALDP